jgi:hypothetical protein
VTQVKGTAVVSTLRFIRERFGPEGVELVRADLDPALQASLPPEPLGSAWYPFPLLVALGRAAARRFGGGLADFHRDLGRASADHGLNTIYRLLFRLGSPHFAVSHATRVWTAHYDSGRMRAVVIEPGHAVLELAGFGEPVPELCERLLGWMSRAVELAGGRDLRIVHGQCVLRGDPTCQFEGWWS